MNAPTPRPLLVIDAGNTRVKCGVFDPLPSGVRGLPPCRAFAAVHCGERLPVAGLFAQAGEEAGESCRAVLAGSNPAELARIRREWPAEWPPPDVLIDRARLGLRIEVNAPERVGIDRLLNAVAANVLREQGRPAVIVDSGTATTVDYVSGEGAFCGGAILPGFELCARALHDYTALLPLVRIEDVRRAGDAPSELGRDTQAAIASGLYWGHVGAVNELVQRLTDSAPNQTAAECVASPLLLLTGGAAPLLLPHLGACVRYEPHLALQGLALGTQREE